LLAVVVLAGALVVLVVLPVVAAPLGALDPSVAEEPLAALELDADVVLGVAVVCTGSRWWCPWWRPYV